MLYFLKNLDGVTMLFGAAASTPPEPYKTIYCFEELISVFQEVDLSKTLVLFDVDKVVLDSSILKSYDQPEGKRMLEEYIQSNYPKAQFEDALLHFATAIKRELIYPELPQFIQELKAKGALCIALTTWPTGKIWGQLRKRDLEAVGIQFEDCGTHMFSDLREYSPKIERFIIPTFENGITCCCYVPKSRVLQEVLKVLGIPFETIIFIDDVIKNLDDVASSVGKEKFIGLHSQAHIELEKSYPNYDAEKWKIQVAEIFQNY